MDQKTGGYGVYYRADGERDITGYVFQYDPGLGDKFVVRKVEKGRETSPIASVQIAKVMGDDFDIMRTPHAISISINGSSHSIKVDGTEVLSFNDSTYSSGSAGLRTWHGMAVALRHLTIYRQQNFNRCYLFKQIDKKYCYCSVLCLI